MAHQSDPRGIADRSVLHIRQLNSQEQSTLREKRLREEEIWDTWKTTQVLEVGPDRVDDDFDTDLVSVPNIFAWFVPRAGRYARAAVLHDYLWRYPDRHPGDRRTSDKRFREQMKADGVSLPRRWMMWAAVRVTAIWKRDPGKGWRKDIPVLLVLAIIAVPILVPPAIVITASNMAFYVLELLAWPIDRPTPTPPTPQLKT